MKLINKKIFIVGFSFLCASLTLNLHANSLAPSSELQYTDQAGVDLLSALPTFSHTDLSIGNGDLSLTHNYSSHAGFFASFYDLTKAYVDYRPTQTGIFANVRMGTNAYDFKLINGVYRPESGDGSTLTGSSQSGWIFTDRNGLKFYSGNGQERRIVYPNGFTIKIGARYLATNTGLQFRYDYSDDPNSAGLLLNKITAINAAYVYCDLAATCNFSSDWPKASYKWINKTSAINQEYTFQITDAEGTITKYVHENFPVEGRTRIHPRVTKVYENGDIQPTKTYSYDEYKDCVSDGPGSYFWTCKEPKILVYIVKVRGTTFTYTWRQSPGIYSSTSGNMTSSAGNAYIASTVYKGNRPLLSQSGWRDGSAIYDGSNLNRLSNLTYKDIEYAYEYDFRGNITKRTQMPVQQTSGFSVGNLVETAGFPSTCTNPKTCNKPIWTRDAKGYQTDYQYHAQSGQISKITLPADKDGIRPQTRYFYEQKYAYYKNSSGNIVRASSPVWLLTKTSECMKGNASGNGCALPNDEVFTLYKYGENGVANNLWLTGMTKVANGQIRRTCYTYDKYGNKLSETQPNANISRCN